MTDIVTAEILITRVIADDGRMVVRVKLPNPYNAVEVLGMLEMARIAIFNDLNPGG